QHFDDFHFLEITDIRDLDFHHAHLLSPLVCRSFTYRAPGLDGQVLHAPCPSSCIRRREMSFWDYCVTGLALFGSIPYFLMASATTLFSIAPSSASVFSAATVTK